MKKENITPAEKKAYALLKYIQEHPDQRFWQALLNVSGLPYIAISPLPPKDIDKRLQDTYYLEDDNN